MPIKWRLINIWRLLMGQSILIPGDRNLFCDVDDTLAMWQSNNNYTPNNEHLGLLERFSKRGLPIIVWSAGGFEWADRIVKEYGLLNKVWVTIAKPEWFVDDLPAHEFMFEHNRIYLSSQESGLAQDTTAPTNTGNKFLQET